MKTRIAQLDMHRSFPVKTESTLAAESIRFVMLIFNAALWRSGPSRPPWGPNSFNFMQFLGKFGKIVCCPPPRELALPTWGNPGPVLVTDNHYSLQGH